MTRDLSQERNVYGYANGEPVYSRDEFVFAVRGFGAIEEDAELLEFAKKVTSDWCNAGWHRTFISYYLSEYALEEPYRSLTHKEFARLKQLQAEAIAAEKRAEEERGWRVIGRYYYADNSVDDVREDKYGERKTLTVVQPHGDIC